MNLIINKVMQLEVVHVAYGNGVIEHFAGTSVVKPCFTVNNLEDFLFGELGKLFDISSILFIKSKYLFLAVFVDFFGYENLTVEVFAKFTVNLVKFNVAVYSGVNKCVENVAFVSAVKYRCANLPAESLCGAAEVYLKHLSDVHTGRYAEGVKNDIKRTAVGQERHILNGENTGNNALVSVTSCHFVADADFTFLGNVAANNHAYAGVELA